MKTYIYKLHPSKSQIESLNRCLYLTRNLYNEGLQELIDIYKNTGKHLSRYDHDKLHNKKRWPELHSWIVDETLNRLHRSFANFFRGIKTAKRTGFPRFKTINSWTSFSSQLLARNDAFKIKDVAYIKLWKSFGKIRVSRHIEPLGNQKLTRIIKKPSGWYYQVVTDYEEPKMEYNDKSIGLDFGITNLIADSEGNFTENPQFLKQSLKKLRVAQRSLLRKKKGGKNRTKIRQIVARIHERISNQRLDAYHKITRNYVNNYGMIYIEDLKPSNMVKNHNFARSIMDSSWGILRNLLEVKAESAGRQVIAVPPHYTSQKCSKCGEIVQKSLSVRTHSCSCGYIDDRDVNAARNILRSGLDRQALTYSTS